MIDSVDTEQDIERLMSHIREVASRRVPMVRRPGRSYIDRVRDHESSLLDLPPLKPSPDFRPSEDNRYHVNDLMKYHDRYFVQNAYRAILKREPDESGCRGYLEQLRSGAINKIDVLARLRDSTEGRQCDVVIEGLKLKAYIRKVGRLPVVGYLLQLIIALGRLPLTSKDKRRFENYSLAQHLELVDHINKVTETVRTLTETANTWPKRLERQRQELTDLLEQQQQLHNQDLQAHGEQLQRLSRIAVAQEEVAGQLRADLGDQAERLLIQSAAIDRMSTLLSELDAGLSLQQTRSASLIAAIKSPGVDPLQGLGHQDSPMLDTLYAALEDRFRGDREELKEKFRIYLPYLQATNITSNVVDIGSGRGEWLELLKEQGIQATGVDSNLAMVLRCREIGLDVISENGLKYLRSLPDRSVNAVTGFHIIEHLTFSDLTAFVDETVRILKPQGLLLVESPNPENVIVGSCNFYLDPSHLRPVPSQVMQFLLEARGFSHVEVINLHPLPSRRIVGDSELIHRFNDMFYGPMDYGIIARRSPV
jgi:ubiquinone/menaquinone biosynthesis C-methylase UbiE